MSTPKTTRRSSDGAHLHALPSRWALFGFPSQAAFREKLVAEAVAAGYSRRAVPLEFVVGFILDLYLALPTMGRAERRRLRGERKALIAEITADLAAKRTISQLDVWVPTGEPS